jgi:hypothetical protein
VVEYWFDDLTRAAAMGLSRRALLRRLGAGLAGGAMAALLPASARAQPTEACHDFCLENLTGDARGRCQSDATRGAGLCQACAGEADRLCRPTAPNSPVFGQALCCAANQECGSTGCLGAVVATVPSVVTSPSAAAADPVRGSADDAVTYSNYTGEDTASAGNGGVASASANGGAVAIGDVNSGGGAPSAIGVGDLSAPSGGTSPAAAAGAFNQLPQGAVVVPDCPAGTSACGLAGCCPSGTVCGDRGCVSTR